LKVLIADDDAIVRLVLQEFLTQWGYEVICVENGHQALAVLEKEDSPKMAILDWVMPGMDGLTVCRKIRENSEGIYIYILLLTSKNEKKDLIEAMEAGVDDFIAKPPDRRELKMRLRVGMRITNLHGILRHQSTHDFLTGLLNRFAIMDELKKELNRSGRSGKSISIGMADIDNFKQINDTYGHQAGDTVLTQISERIKLSLRSYDAVGRYGGEEFLLVLSKSGQKKAKTIGEKIRSAIAKYPFKIPQGDIHVTMSIGMTTIKPTKKIEIDTLIKMADQALYDAKAGGRDQVVFSKFTNLQ